MFKKLVSTVMAATMLATSSVPVGATMTGEAGQFFYRYKGPLSDRGEVPGLPVGKDVTAFYVGGVGYEFSERLPMKPEWQDDKWRITAGTLPQGLVFDAATLTFSGVPEELVSGRLVELEGYDETGTKVANASATFDVVTVRGQPASVNFYAHTGKYRLDTLPIPDGLTVDKWVRHTAPPEGMTVNGPYFEGTPTKAGDYPVHIIGLNYMDEVVITFVGKYVVEDGPTFPPIADNVKPLRWSVSYGWANRYRFGAPSTHKINHQISKDRQPRYYVEIDSDGDGVPDNMGSLPEPVASNENSLNLILDGWIRTPYNTAVIRYKAIDSDNTVGYSNWFEFGSSDAYPGCNPYYSGYPLVAVTGKENTIRIPKPSTIGDVLFSISEGTVPDDLVLDPATGVLSGVPKTAGEKHSFKVKIDITNQGTTTSTVCDFRMETWAGKLSFVDATPAQDRHIRAGDVYNGVLAVKNGQEDFTVRFDDEAAWPTLGFVTPHLNQPQVKVSGPITAPGTHSVPFTLANGDTTERPTRLTIHSHAELKVDEVPTVTVKRLAASTTWGSIPYDDSTVIPDASGAVSYPRFVLDQPAGLPSDIVFDPSGSFRGATAAAAKTYGPFVATMSDFSGDTVNSKPFSVVVEPRDEIAVERLTPPVFTAEWDRDQKAKPLVVKQPPLAEKFRVDYKLDGPTLPTWLTFDITRGEFTASTGIPHADIGQYGPYTITATDEEGSTVTTDTFSVTVNDWPTPSGSVPAVKGSVSGDPKQGEDVTWMNIPSLRSRIAEDTVIGGRDGVTFLSSEPANPAGLTFDPSDGSFSGEPVSEFDGNVLVKFKDTRDREGTLAVPMTVKPYPTVAMTATEYSVARLSSAHLEELPMAGMQVRGFWTSPTWSWAEDVSASAVEGLTIRRATGEVLGNTAKAEGTVIPGLRLKSVSTGANGEELTSYTDTFSLTVTALRPISVSAKPESIFFYLTELEQGGYDPVDRSSMSVEISGSHTDPVTYSLDTKGVQELTGLSIDPTTGAIDGYPSAPGEWQVDLTARDAEGRKTSTPTTVTLKATLVGDVQFEMPGDAGENELVRVRVGQTFTTAGVDYSQAVGNVVFNSTPSYLPSGFQLDTLKGRFHGQPTASSIGFHNIELYGRDRDGRPLSDTIGYRFEVVAPLAMAPTTSAPTAKQFSAEAPVSVQFAEPSNLIGTASYSLEGDVPGTLVTRNTDAAGIFTGWSWTDANGLAQNLPASAPADQLPLDALVFDAAARTLIGIPSKDGTFAVTMVARDSHATAYIDQTDASRIANNRTSTVATIVVEKAADLQVVNLIGAEQTATETLSQYTSQARIVATAQNAAYGRPVTWTAVSGHLPQGITASKNALTVTYPGYPEVRGSFGPNVWKATDIMGRTATGSAVTFEVGPRLPLELLADEPIGLVVNATIADETVTAKNAAYGRIIPASDWSVGGTDRLPPGITYDIADGGVTFTGTATEIGVFTGVTVSAVDSLGSRATKAITFVVLAPEDPIILEVDNIVTKVGKTFAMQATATNTYGTPRFYSYDIAADLGDQIVIHGASGLVDGRFRAVMDLDFDVYVTDGSDRVTSKPVLVSVLPDLRVTVPQIVSFEPFATKTQTVATDYVVGTVKYEMADPSLWPAGITLDPDTGAISSDGTLGIGEYPGLQIRGTDIFPDGQTDTQVSNAFTIKVEANGAYFELVGGQLDPWKKRLEGYAFDLRRDPYVVNLSGMGDTDILWSLGSQPQGHKVPGGLSINAQGVIVGTPTQSGEFTFTVTGTLRGNARVKRSAVYTMSISLQATKLALLATADGTLPQAEANKTYSFDFKEILDSQNIPLNRVSWSVTQLDPGNTYTGLSISNGILSGTPQGAEWYDIRVKANYVDNNTAIENLTTEQDYRLFIKKRPTVIGSIADRTVSTRQVFDLTPYASYKHASDVYSVVGDFPYGLFYDGHVLDDDEVHYGFEFDPKTGRIHGTSTVSGVFPITLKVTDKFGQETQTAFTLTLVDDTPTFVGNFSAQAGLERGVHAYSNPILVSGNPNPANTVLDADSGTYVYTCSSGQAQQGYCTGGGYNPASKFTIKSGTYIQIRVVTPTTFDTDKVAKLTIGGVDREFRVKTRVSVSVPTSLAEFDPVTNAGTGNAYYSNPVKFEGLTDAAEVTLEAENTYGNASVYVCSDASAKAGTCGNASSTEATSGTAKFSVPKDAWIVLQLNAGYDFATTRTARIKVGDITREFNVTTRETVVTPRSVGQFDPVVGADTGYTYYSNPVKFEGLTDTAEVMLEAGNTYGNATAYVCSDASARAGTCGQGSTAAATSGTAKFSVPKDAWVVLQLNSGYDFATTRTARIKVGDITREFNVTTRSSVAVPTAVAEFEPVTAATTGAQYYSNPVKFEGLTDTATVTLEAVNSYGSVIAYVCSQSLAATGACGNGSSTASTAGSVTLSVPKDSWVVLQLNSGYDFATTRTARIKVGNITRDFNVTTAATADAATFSDHFNDADGLEKGDIAYSNAIQIGVTENTTFSLEDVDGTGGVANAYVCSTRSYALQGYCYLSSRSRTNIELGGSGTVRPGEFIQIRAASANTFSASRTVRLVVGGVAREFKITTRGSNTVPLDLAGFQSVSDLEKGSASYSNAIQVNGITDATTFSLEDADGTGLGANAYVCATQGIALQGYCYISSRNRLAIELGGSGTVRPGEFIQIRATAANAFSTSRTVRLVVGGVAREFKITTRGSNTVPVSLAHFSSVTSTERSAVSYSNAIQINGITDNATVTLEDVDGKGIAATAYICATESSALQGYCYISSRNRTSIALGGSGTVRPGEYIQVRADAAAEYSTPRTVRLVVGGVARDFTVTTRDSNITPVNLGNFEDIIDAEKSSQYASGIIRFDGLTDNATVSIENIENAANATLYVCRTAYANGSSCMASGWYSRTGRPGGTVTVAPGEAVQITASSAATAGARVAVRIKVGELEREWTVTTKSEDVAP